MACHQVTEWSLENTLSAINIIVSALAIVFSGVLVYCLEKRRGNKREKERKRNLIKGLQSETQVNIEFAEHNVRMIQNHTATGTLAGLQSLNLLSFKNACADEILGYANISLSGEQRKSIRHYIVVVEHVNSIIKDYLESKKPDGTLRVDKASDVERFCSTDKDSLTKAINEIDFHSLFDSI